MILPDPFRRAATALGFGLLAAGAFVLALVRVGQAFHLSNETVDLWWRWGAAGSYVLAGGAAILVVFALTFNLTPGMSGWLLAGAGLLIAAILATRLPGGAYLAAVLASAGLLVAIWPSPPARIAAAIVIVGSLAATYEFQHFESTTALRLDLIQTLGLPLAFALAAWTGARASARRTL